MVTKSRKKERRESRYVDARKAAAKRETSTGWTSLNLPEKVQMFSLQKAEPHRVEIIPYEVTQKGNPMAKKGFMYYERTFWTHRGIGPNRSSYICPAKTWGKRCPVCESVAEASRDPSADKELVKSLRPKQRQLFNVFDHENPNRGVQIWEISYHLFGVTLEDKLKDADDDDEWESFYHPKNGKTLKLSVKKDSMGNNDFFRVSNIEFKDRKKSLKDSLLEQANDLDSILAEVEYKDLKKVFFDGLVGVDVDDEDEDEDEDEDTPRRSKKPKSKRRSRDEEEDEEEEDESDEDEEEDDEDEEDEDEDEDDEDEEDEDEDEPPRRKKKKGKKQKVLKKDKKKGKWDEEDDEWGED